MKSLWGAILLGLLVGAAAAVGEKAEQTGLANPHNDPIHGVDRIQTIPPTTGQCTQCHRQHDNAGDAPSPKNLFTENSNQLCYDAGGPNGCHAVTPTGYPAGEADRLPSDASSPGYFEANANGQRLYGIHQRKRWSGATVYEDARTFAPDRYYSPHRNDLDMPRFDGSDQGLCLNCHNPHEGESDHDLLNVVYQPYGGPWPQRAATRLAACLNCHGPLGPLGMEEENRGIADYYDSGVNPDGHAGHAIRKNPDIAISWPPHVRVGDPLPCYDCHNPHGSRGNDGVSPNGFLISDQRPGWSGLTATRTNPEQSRRFCLGCHIPSDGVPGSITVGGIVMNTLPDEDEHTRLSTEGCFECHGADYSSPNSYNVHHPSEGD